MSLAEAVSREIRWGLRRIWTRRGFSAIVIAVFAVGVAVNLAMFFAVQALVLSPPWTNGLEEPKHIVALWQQNSSAGLLPNGRFPVDPGTYLAWKASTRSFADIELYNTSRSILSTSASGSSLSSKPEVEHAASITYGFLQMLGVHLEAGRYFSKGEMNPGAPGAAILTHQMAVSLYSGEATALDKVIYLDAKPYRVVGVLASDFQELPPAAEDVPTQPAVFLPMQDPEPFGIVLGRLTSGVSIASAQAEANAMAIRLRQTDPARYGELRVSIYTLTDEAISSHLRMLLEALQAAVLLVLLVACANASGLLVGDMVTREHDFAVQVALGATYVRIGFRVAVEIVLMTVIGGLFGAGICEFSLKLISRVAQPGMRLGALQVGIERTLAFTAVVICASAIVAIALSLGHLFSSTVAIGLSRGGRSGTGSGYQVRKWLIVTELSLSLTLLVGAGLMIKTMSALLRQDMGFAVDNLFVGDIVVPQQIQNKITKEGREGQLLAQLNSNPAIRAAALADSLPLLNQQVSTYSVDGRPMSAKQSSLANLARVSARYFETMVTPLIVGRSFAPEEAANSLHVCVVSIGFARSNWPGADPIGKSLSLTSTYDAGSVYRVIGVVKDELQSGPDAEPQPEIYIPTVEMPRPILIVRAASSSRLDVDSAVSRAMASIGENWATTGMEPMQTILAGELLTRRLATIVLSVFSIAAILLAAIGLYGLVAFDVRSRSREVSIRLALGAPRSEVVMTFLRRMFVSIGWGVSSGVVLAVILTRFIRSILFGVKSLDLTVYLIVPSILMGVVLLAVYLATKSIAKADPAELLRTE